MSKSIEETIKILNQLLSKTQAECHLLETEIELLKWRIVALESELVIQNTLNDYENRRMVGGDI